jgi:hypothetical protein
MTREPASTPCPKCGAKRHKLHAPTHDIAVCGGCGHRETIEYRRD